MIFLYAGIIYSMNNQFHILILDLGFFKNYYYFLSQVHLDDCIPAFEVRHIDGMKLLVHIYFNIAFLPVFAFKLSASITICLFHKSF